ncbi:hypothetical protein CAURIS_03770 [Corynebacterium auris]|nr:hypothetical protein CAURIS_03770 [Corynebacterium auris]
MRGRYVYKVARPLPSWRAAEASWVWFLPLLRKDWALCLGSILPSPRRRRTIRSSKGRYTTTVDLTGVDLFIQAASRAVGPPNQAVHLRPQLLRVHLPRDLHGLRVDSRPARVGVPVEVVQRLDDNALLPLARRTIAGGLPRPFFVLALVLRASAGLLVGSFVDGSLFRVCEEGCAPGEPLECCGARDAHALDEVLHRVRRHDERAGVGALADEGERGVDAAEVG